MKTEIIKKIIYFLLTINYICIFHFNIKAQNNYTMGKKTTFVKPTFTKKTRLTITDTKDGNMVIIDTILSEQASVEAVIKKLGYSTNGEITPKVKNFTTDRNVKISVKEFIESPELQSLSQIEDMGDFPPEVKQNNPNDRERGASIEGVTYIKGAPRTRISIEQPDFIDAAILNQKNEDLLNAKRLNVQNFSISPNYKEAHYEFSWDILEKNDTWINIYDAVGLAVYSEFMANYEGHFQKMLHEFSIFTKGTFFVLITQPNKKFVTKVTFKED